MSSLYCLFSDFECRLWPIMAISVKVIEGKVPLFFIGLAMFKMAFFCQTSPFRDPLASGPLLQTILDTGHFLLRGHGIVTSHHIVTADDTINS